jgi:predicted esterase
MPSRRTGAAALLCVYAGAQAQAQAPGPQVLTYFSAIDESDQPYALYLPKDFDPSRKYPLVISLHGADSNHRLNLKRVFGKGNLRGESDAEASRYFPRFRDVGFIVASPFARGTLGYQGLPEQDVYDVMADVKRRLPIDEDRVYLTGLSMGGGGTLWLGLTRPDLWAAIAPVCPLVPDGTVELAGNALHLPVRLFHGEQDPVVPVAGTRLWQKRLLDLGVNAEYVEYPGVRHNAWDYAYKDAQIFDWFARFRRDPHPDRVRFTSAAYKYGLAYWVEFDALTPGTLARIDVHFAAKNRIEAATKNLDGFTLRLAGHPQFVPGQPVSVTIDGGKALAVRGATLSFERTPAGWRAGHAKAEGKRAGAEGPIREAVAGRHIYVYGTADSPPPEELKRRREVAERAAAWSWSRARLLLGLPVKADRDLTAQDRDSANLVLFGTRETNRAIARFAAGLPVALNAGAADYGLVYIFPEGKRYVLVNSGLSWWTGAEDAERGGFDRYAPHLRPLATFGDFVLFKGSLTHVVVEGRFDRNWRLPPASAQAMAATGAVAVR